LVNCSHTTPSVIDGLYITSTGLDTGIPCLARLEGDDWTPLRSNGADTIGGAEYQQTNIGGVSGTKNWPITLEIDYCPDVVFAGLRTKRAASGLYAATFVLAATDALGVERVLPFTALRFIADVTHQTRRFAGRIYETVRVALYSEA
jgi:hypothetical protein